MTSSIHRRIRTSTACIAICFLFLTALTAQRDTISFDQALENVNYSRQEKRGEELWQNLEILAIRHLVEKEDLAAAVNTYMEAIDAMKLYQDSSAIYKLHVDLALLHTYSAQYNLALNLLEEAADYYAAVGDSVQLGIVQNFIADTYLMTPLASSAKPYIRVIKQYDTTSPLLRTLYGNTNTAMIRNGMIADSIAPPDTTAVERPPSRTTQDRDFSGLTDLNAGYYQFQNRNFALADLYLRSAVASAADGVILRDALDYLASMHSDFGDYDAAYLYRTRYAAVNDSLLSQRRQQVINKLRLELESNEKEKQIIDLESDRKITEIQTKMERITTGSLFIASIIVLLGAYFAIRNYQKRLNTNQIIHVQHEEITKRKISELENNLKLETMQSMINGQEAERERISKELHDSLGGLLSTVKLHFDALQTHDEQLTSRKEYRKAYSLLDEACNEVRSIANNMQPDALQAMGLVPAINDLVNRIESAETPQIEFQHFDVNGRIQPTAALNVYRIVQELLNNSIKHADATQILIQLIQKDDELMVTVEDDGEGFDPETVETGMGTGNIASRVNFLKGEISVQSAQGEGTSTLITIPLS